MDDGAVDEALQNFPAVALHAFGGDGVVGDQLAVDAGQRLFADARVHRSAARFRRVFSGRSFTRPQELKGHRGHDHDDSRSCRDPGRSRAIGARIVGRICLGRNAHRTCTPECRVLSAASMPPTVERSVARGRDYKTGAKTGQVVLNERSGTAHVATCGQTRLAASFAGAEERLPGADRASRVGRLRRPAKAPWPGPRTNATRAGARAPGGRSRRDRSSGSRRSATRAGSRTSLACSFR